MKILLLIILLPLLTFSQVVVTGKVTDEYGKGISKMKVRIQGTGCFETDPEMFYVYESYGYTNPFGYYKTELMSTCVVYSVRILGNVRYNQWKFDRQFYAFNNPNKLDLFIEDYNFTYEY